MLTASFLLSATLSAQPPYWKWVTSAGGSAEDKPLSIATDNANYLYITGYYLSPSIVFGTDTLTSPYSLFLVKYDANGNIVRVKSSSGSNNNRGNSVVTDKQDNVYLGGYFASKTISFDSILLTKTDTTNSWSNMFLVKYDSSGHVIWAKSAYSNASSSVYALACNDMGNLFVSGFFMDTLIIGPDTLVQFAKFIAKYDTSGIAQWGRRIVATDGLPDSNGPFIAADKFGNVYAAGGFFEPVGLVDTVQMINHGNYDAYLAKFDGAGNVQWVHNYGGSNNSQASSVACDTSGNVYLTGFFVDVSITFDTITLTAPGSIHAFLVKFNPSGSALWARKIMWLWGQKPLKVTVDKNNDVYLTGYFGGFNSPGFLFTPTDSLTNEGLFLAKYDSNGNFKWARDAIGGNIATAVAIGPDGTPYITGYFSSDTLIFDSNVLLHSPSNGTDILVAAMGSITGMEELDGSSPFAFSVFPNPSNGRFYLISNVPEQTSLTVYDLMGKSLWSETVNAGLHFIDLSQKPKGIYIITLRTSKSCSSKKIVLY